MKLYTGGTFDLFHYGHMSFLKNCKKLCDNLIVALNEDEFIYDYKKEYPIMSFSERYLSISSFDPSITIVVNSGGQDSKPAIESVEPDIIAIGDDWRHKDYYKQMNFTQEWLDRKGILLVYLPYTKDISSTEIKKRIFLQNDQSANPN